MRTTGAASLDDRADELLATICGAIIEGVEGKEFEVVTVADVVLCGCGESGMCSKLVTDGCELEVLIAALDRSEAEIVKICGIDLIRGISFKIKGFVVVCIAGIDCAGEQHDMERLGVAVDGMLWPVRAVGLKILKTRLASLETRISSVRVLGAVVILHKGIEGLEITMGHVANRFGAA